MSDIQPLGRCFRLRELIDANPGWEITEHGYLVTASLKSDPSVHATADPLTGQPRPIPVPVMVNVLADWRAQHGTAHCRMGRYAGPQ